MIQSSLPSYNPDTKNAETKWRNAIKKRDGAQCRMLLKVGEAWVECGNTTYVLQSAHIFPRRECAGARFDHKGRTGILACVLCHSALDGMDDGKRIVKVPWPRVVLAAKCIYLNSKQQLNKILDILVISGSLVQDVNTNLYVQIGDWTDAE